MTREFDAMLDEFFKEQREESAIKSRIVSNYFSAWAKVVIPSATRPSITRRETGIAYLDLFAGPGRYEDGKPSTPLLVLDAAVKDVDISRALRSYFYDSNASYVSSLKNEIKNLPNIRNLKHYPVVTNLKIDQQFEVILAEMKLIPTFSFIDPFGYTGFSLNLLSALTKDWGCDCIFLFNYNRISPALNNPNPQVIDRMKHVLGEEFFNEMKEKTRCLKGEARKNQILEMLAMKIKDIGGKHVLPFQFYSRSGVRPQHMLIFVSKHFRGYDIMKGIMKKESPTDDRFGYSQADDSTPLLFSFIQPLNKDELLKKFSGKELTRRRIYEEHSIDKPFVESDYTKALKELEEDGKINPYATRGERRRGTFSKHTIIRFPNPL